MKSNIHLISNLGKNALPGAISENHLGLRKWTIGNSCTRLFPVLTSHLASIWLFFLSLFQLIVQLLVLPCLLLMLFSTPHRFVNRCCSGFPVSSGIGPSQVKTAFFQSRFSPWIHVP